MRSWIASGVTLLSLLMLGWDGGQVDYTTGRRNDVRIAAANLVTQTTGGVDETLATQYIAFKFTMSGTQMGGVSVNLKRDVGTSAGTLTSYLFSDNAGSPNANISDGSTGLPSILYVANVGTTYSTYQFRLPQSGMTNGGSYWIVLFVSGVSGGNVFLERQTAGTNLYATSADASAWSVVSNKQPVYRILSDSSRGFYGYSDTGQGIYGESSSGFGVRGVSIVGPGAKFDSTYNFGVGGTSFYGIGVRGSSNTNIAVQGVSTGSAGGQFQTTAAGQVGMQAIATTGAAMQGIVGTSGKAFSLLNSDQGFAETLFMDGLGNEYVLPGSGAYMLRGSWTEVISISAATTADSTTDLPANALIDGISWRVTTSITGGAANFSLGTAATATKFQAATTAITAGSTGVGLNQWATAGNVINTAAGKLRLTLNAAGTGAVRVTVSYRQFSAPSS